LISASGNPIGVSLSAPATPAAYAAGESKGKKIAFLQTLATHPYVVATTKSFRGRAEALGMEVTLLTSMLDAALQAQQIDARLQDGARGHRLEVSRIDLSQRQSECVRMSRLRVCHLSYARQK
jgi:hypothetical protein